MTSLQATSAREVLRVRPFRGVRFAPGSGGLEDLTFTPPAAWAGVPADLLDGLHPNHVLRLLAPVFGGDAAGGARQVRSRLRSWLDVGVVDRDPEPALYVYERSAGDETVVGLIGSVDLGPPGQPAFLDHEEVIDALVDAQEQLERTAEAQIEPILALHRGSADLDAVLGKATAGVPDAGMTDTSGIVHRLWSVTDPDVQAAIARAVPDEPALIADGHHRHAAWSRVAAGRDDEPQGSALACLVGSNQPGLQLGAVHRVVSGLDLDRAVASELVHSEPLPGRETAEKVLASGRESICVLYAAGRYHAVTAAQRLAACAAPSLAVCHLHSVWLPQWGVPESAVGYVHRLDEAVSAADDGRVAVLLPVTDIDDVFAAAHRGRPLPRKATSFGPKPLVGMVLRSWAS